MSGFVEFVASAMSHTFIFGGELDGRSNGVIGSDTDVAYNIDNVCLDVVGTSCGGVAAGAPEPPGLALLALALAAFVRYRRGAA
jgi:MYXO-CTERM domain-containing protein